MVNKPLNWQGSYEDHLLGFGDKAQDIQLSYLYCAKKKKFGDDYNKEEAEAYQRGHNQIHDLNVDQIRLHPQRQPSVQDPDHPGLQIELAAQSVQAYSTRQEF